MHNEKQLQAGIRSIRRRDVLIGATVVTLGGCSAPVQVILETAPPTPASPSLQTCGQSAVVVPESEIYCDDYGLIVQRDCDGGDTAQREGWYWLGTWIRASDHLRKTWPFSRSLSFEQVMAALEVGQTGTFRRHPRKWNDPADFTRDQTIPLVAAMGVKDDGARLQRFYYELRRRNWMAQKPGDIMFDPIHRNLVRRAMNQEPGRFLDALSFRAAAWARKKASEADMDNVGDDLNLVIMFVVAAVRKPNDDVDAARRYYVSVRPRNYGMFLGRYREENGTDSSGKTARSMAALIKTGIDKGWKAECSPIMGALRWYFRAESGGCPGLATLYEPVVQKWFSHRDYPV